MTSRVRRQPVQSRANPRNEGGQMEPIYHLHISCPAPSDFPSLFSLLLGFEKAKCNICFSYGNFQFVAEELTMFATEQKRKNIIVFLTCLFLLPRKTQPYLFLVLQYSMLSILSA